MQHRDRAGAVDRGTAILKNGSFGEQGRVLFEFPVVLLEFPVVSFESPVLPVKTGGHFSGLRQRSAPARGSTSAGAFAR